METHCYTKIFLDTPIWHARNAIALFIVERETGNIILVALLELTLNNQSMLARHKMHRNDEKGKYIVSFWVFMKYID